MKTRKRIRYNDPFRRLKWVPIFWCLVLIAAANYGWNNVSEKADAYYASVQTAAGK